MGKIQSLWKRNLLEGIVLDAQVETRPSFSHIRLQISKLKSGPCYESTCLLCTHLPVKYAKSSWDQFAYLTGRLLYTKTILNYLHKIVHGNRIISNTKAPPYNYSLAASKREKPCSRVLLIGLAMCKVSFSGTHRWVWTSMLI